MNSPCWDGNSVHILAQGLAKHRYLWGLGRGSQKKDEKYLLRAGNEASVGVRICASELVAGQGSGKNVGLGARSLALPSFSVWPQGVTSPLCTIPLLCKL